MHIHVYMIMEPFKKGMSKGETSPICYLVFKMLLNDTQYAMLKKAVRLK